MALRPYTEADEEALRREIQQGAMAVPPHVISLRPALPWRIRLRLRLTRYADDVAYWLVCHDHCTAAKRLYQLCGLW